jgi:peptidoglycan hydrolase-like protein with peptidoglycan-binding domain
VVVLQVSLNRIAQNYPAIPKIPAVDGIFGPQTERSVSAFQQIFGLSPDGIVGPATWYAIVRLYTAVTALSELRSQGQQFYAINWSAPNALQTGDTGDKVRQLQYMLSVLSAYIPEIPPVTIDGIFGNITRAAVTAAQRRFGLPETGVVNSATWDEIYDQFAGIENRSLLAVPAESAAVATFSATPSQNRPRNNASTSITQFPGTDLRLGHQDPPRQEVLV